MKTKLLNLFLAARPLFDPENGEHEALRVALREALVELYIAGELHSAGMTKADYENELENFS